MTSEDEATRPAQEGAAAQLPEDRPLTVTMVTRCALMPGGEACCYHSGWALARGRLSWRVLIVSDATPPGTATEGRNGMVIKGHDPSHYAAALRRLADPLTRAAMADASRQDARRLTANSTSAAYAAVAESIAGIQ